MSSYTEPFSLETAKMFFEYDKEEGGVLWKKRTPDMYQVSYNPVRDCTQFNNRWADKQVGCAFRRQKKKTPTYEPKWKAVSFRFCDPRTGISGSKTYIHRLVWLMEHGYWPKQPIDHINGDPLDNRVENLRMVDYKANNQNLAVYRNNTSGYMGVERLPNGKYRARITVDGKRIHLGMYFTKEAAAEARQLAEKQYGFHPDHGKRISPDHGVKINVESSTTSSVCAGDDSPSEPVQGELPFL